MNSQIHSPRSPRRSYWPIFMLSSMSAAVNIILPLVLVRILDPHSIGQFKIFFLYLSIVPAFSLTAGLLSGLAYWAGNEKKRESAIQISGQLMLLLAVVVSAGVCLLHGYVAHWLDWPSVYGWYFSAALIGAIAGSYFEEAAIAVGRIWIGSLFYSGFEIIRAVSIVLTVLQFRSLESVVLVHLLISVLKVLIGYLWGMRLGIAGVKFERAMLGEVWRYAYPVSIAAMGAVLVNSADQLILAQVISPTEFAFYTIGCLALPPLLILEQSVTRVLIPQLSEAFMAKHPERARTLFRGSIDQLALFLFPAVAGLIVFRKPIIEVLFTSQYSSATQYLGFFALSYLFLCFPYDAVPRARGQAHWILRCFALFSVFSLVLTFALAMLWGAMGALFGLLISRASMRAYAMWYVHESTGWSFFEFLPIDNLWRYAAISGGLGLLAILFQPLFHSMFLWFLVLGPVCAFGFLLLAARLRRSYGQRVLIVTQHMSLGGLERMVVNLCAELVPLGFEPTVFSYDHAVADDTEDLVPALRSLGVEVIAFKKNEGFSLFVMLRLAWCAFSKGIKVIHSHNLGGLIYSVGAKFLLGGTVKIVHTQHSFVHIEEHSQYLRYEKWFTPFASCVVGVSQDVLATYAKLGIRAKRLELIENGIAVPREKWAFSHELRVAKKRKLCESLARADLLPYASDFWVLYLARLYPRKGQNYALQIWKHLPQEIRAKSVLLFVGPDSDPRYANEVKQMTRQVSDAGRVHFLGALRNPEQILCASDVFLSCSEMEGQPLTVLEALTCGIPCVLSNIPGHEIFRATACLFDLQSPAQGSREITRLLSSENGKVPSEAGNQLIERFSSRQMASRYLALYVSQ